MMLQVWIASRCCDTDRAGFLVDAITSCLQQQSPIVNEIHVALDAPLDVKAYLSSRLVTAVTIHEGVKGASQFGHLSYLNRVLPVCDDDWIVFLDDDDVLLSDASHLLTTGHSMGMVGYQWIGCDKTTSISLPGGNTVLSKDVPTFIKQHQNTILSDTDFSGTVLRRRYVSEFFKNWEEPKGALAHLEDITFMSYVDKLSNKAMPADKVAYKRVGTGSHWIEEVRDELLMLKQGLK